MDTTVILAQPRVSRLRADAVYVQNRGCGERRPVPELRAVLVLPSGIGSTSCAEGCMNTANATRLMRHGCDRRLVDKHRSCMSDSKDLIYWGGYVERDGIL